MSTPPSIESVTVMLLPWLASIAGGEKNMRVDSAPAGGPGGGDGGWFTAGAVAGGALSGGAVAGGCSGGAVAGGAVGVGAVAGGAVAGGAVAGGVAVDMAAGCVTAALGCCGAGG